MIPYSIFAARISGAGFSAPEVRAVSLEHRSFTFRLSHRIDREAVLRADSAEVAFFSWEKQCYEKLLLRAGEFAVTALPEESDFYDSYRLTTEEDAFFRLAGSLLAEYSRYIMSKLAGEEETFAKPQTDGDSGGWEITDLASHVRALGERTVHPQEVRAASVREECAESDSVREVRERTVSSRKEQWAGVCSQAEFGLRLDRPKLIEEFLSRPIGEVFETLLFEQGLNAHPIAALKPSILYVGNEFCPELFPECRMEAIFRKACEEKLSLVWMLAPMRERDVERYAEILETLRVIYEKSGRELTLMVNDFGTADLAKKILDQREDPERRHADPSFRLILGTLLHKRRKDPRMKRRAGGRDELLGQSGLLDDAYRAYLRRIGFSGFTAETVGYDQELAPDTEALFFPWYQTNTAGLCTLAALIQRGDRGNQRLQPQGSCPHYCERMACVYPDLPELIGRGNSLYAFDGKALQDPEYLRRLLAQGVKTLVFCPM